MRKTAGFRSLPVPVSLATWAVADADWAACHVGDRHRDRDPTDRDRVEKRRRYEALDWARMRVMAARASECAKCAARSRWHRSRWPGDRDARTETRLGLVAVAFSQRCEV